jgi:hypothetical protein
MNVKMNVNINYEKIGYITTNSDNILLMLLTKLTYYEVSSLNQQ